MPQDSTAQSLIHLYISPHQNIVNLSVANPYDTHCPSDEIRNTKKLTTIIILWANIINHSRLIIITLVDKIHLKNEFQGCKMDNLLKEIGNRIIARRKQMRLTQEELSELAGVTAQTISNAELGKKALRPENIIRLCTAMEISTDYLLLGNVSGDDISKLSQKVSRLTPDQYRHLEDIIDSYIAAVQGTSQSKC